MSTDFNVQMASVVTAYRRASLMESSLLCLPRLSWAALQFPELSAFANLFQQSSV